MARKPSTKTLVPDLPDQPDPAEMMNLELTEFEDAPDSVDGVYAMAKTSVTTVTGIEAEVHLSTNSKGQPRVGMRLGTFKRVTDYLLHLDVANVALRSAVSDLHENLETSERQRIELKDATVAASARITELEGLLAHERSKAEALAELARESPATTAAPAVVPEAVHHVVVSPSAVSDLLVKVAAYRSGLSTQRGGAEAILAFDEVFLAANKI